MARRQQRTPPTGGSTTRSDKPVEPRMPAHRDTCDLGSASEHTWTGSTLSGSLAPDHDGRLVMMEVHLGPASMVGARISGSRLIDVVVDGADLAGARLDGSSLTRVEVRDARLSGAQFDQARLRDVRFVRCILDDANFALSQGERVRFEECRMPRSTFSGAVLDGVAWWDCDLSDAEFSQVRVSRAQIHGSTIDGLHGAASLVPVGIDRHQFAAFAEHLLDTLGVTVSERDP